MLDHIVQHVTSINTANEITIYVHKDKHLYLSIYVDIHIHTYINTHVYWSILVMWLGCRFLDTEIDGSKPAVSVCCVLEQGTYSALLLSSTTTREYPYEGCLFSAMSSLEEIALKINA